MHHSLAGSVVIVDTIAAIAPAKAVSSALTSAVGCNAIRFEVGVEKEEICNFLLRKKSKLTELSSVHCVGARLPAMDQSDRIASADRIRLRLATSHSRTITDTESPGRQPASRPDKPGSSLCRATPLTRVPLSTQSKALRSIAIQSAAAAMAVADRHLPPTMVTHNGSCYRAAAVAASESAKTDSSKRATKANDKCPSSGTPPLPPPHKQWPPVPMIATTFGGRTDAVSS